MVQDVEERQNGPVRPRVRNAYVWPLYAHDRNSPAAGPFSVHRPLRPGTVGVPLPHHPERAPQGRGPRVVRVCQRRVPHRVQFAAHVATGASAQFDAAVFVADGFVQPKELPALLPDRIRARNAVEEAARRYNARRSRRACAAV